MRISQNNIFKLRKKFYILYLVAMPMRMFMVKHFIDKVLKAVVVKAWEMISGG